ncbi:hypothetical protein [uncultured Thiodictyon sp.]|uniref:hypothetical protein n=1 Tax=uncultured Thiodictyon sp. TaxID=1846217 RepID=UPI0025CD6A38|nr:hypothetical protein [uncultured Thiodictyon sp.]
MLKSGHITHPWIWRRNVSAVWTNAPTWREPRVAYPEIEFPAEWQQVCLVNDRTAIYLNRDHWLIRATSKHAWERLIDGTAGSLDPRTRREECAASSELSAAWFLYCLSSSNETLVRGLAEHAPDLIQELWKSASSDQTEPTCWAWIAHTPGGALVEIGAHGWREFDPDNSDDQRVCDEVMQKPSEDWCVYPVSGVNEEDQ